MADSKVAKARKRLKTVATNVTADDLTIEAARIQLGSLGAAEEFAAEGAYCSNKPVLVIGSSALGLSGTYNPLTVDAVLAVPLSGESAHDWANVENLVAALRAAWLTVGNYPTGEVKARQCDYDKYQVEVRGDVTIVRVGLWVAFDSPDG